MQSQFNAKVLVNDEEIPDFRSFRVSRQLGLAETSFSVAVDRPVDLDNGDLVSISYMIGGEWYSVVTNKRIEESNKSAKDISFKGAGSFISRYSSGRAIVFVNETWLKALYSSYFFRNGIIYQGDPGSSPIQHRGVSVMRLFVPGLPGKEVRDCEFECVLKSGISYRDIADFIGERTGYKIHAPLPQMFVQKTFTIESGQSYFDALNRLFGIFNPLPYIRENTIYILDIGGDAQDKPAGTRIVQLNEQSFTLLNYQKSDVTTIVDHLLLLGPTYDWIYINRTGKSTTRVTYPEIDLPGASEFLAYEFDYEEESGNYLGQLQQELSANGVELTNEEIFEFLNVGAEKNGRQTRFVEIRRNEDTDESATIAETIETYNVGGELVHRVEIKYQWADYNLPVGHTIIESARLGVIEGDITEEEIDGFKNTVPQQHEFVPIMGKIVRFGSYIGETGLVDADIDEYHKVQWLVDDDTIEQEGGEDLEVKVRRRPQIVTRNSLIGITPYTWEPPEDEEDTENGWKDGMFLVRRERIRYDTVSDSLLSKIRHVEEYLPIKSNKVYTEDIPIKRKKVTRDQTQKRWEFFKVGNSIIQWDGTGPVPQPTEGDPNAVPGQPASFHPKITLHCPDLIDDAIAFRIAKRIFAKATTGNTSATIRTTVPIPGIEIGNIFAIPACSKRYFDWGIKSYVTVTLEARYMWVTGITTACDFEGDLNKTTRKGALFTEFELRDNF